ncbi:hypothetical protein AQS8620_01918 [Aquimixticola soesokkakensis]|uniref:Uncharacterized protein n=1 Tax=Aquimixticola soesokkakensis TaxID=1519096 RepID=A0A1Y5SVY6_9RHOB|nr:hypothetical protein [Aquimixticola soesokkakensis]SLN46407.1 hypothetical protein AQS8620_01918 [Aquimixticola soesokkakensis]
MPLDRFVLILIVVIVAAGASIWVASLITVTLTTPFALLVMIPTGLVAYVVLRVIEERVTSKEDSHYDRIQK